MNKYFKRAEKYMKLHPMYNAVVHALGGIALGIAITYPLIGAHPVRWAAIFLALAIAGHVYASTKK